VAKTNALPNDKNYIDDESIERRRVRRVPLGDNLVFLFEADHPATNGDLTCTMLLEGETPDEALQQRWMDISRHIYIRIPNNQIIRANQISASILGNSTSPVQKLIFDTEGQVPISIGCDDPGLMLEVYFPYEVSRALSDDLGGKSPPILDIAF
jgi:hypothetical protein